MKFLLTLSLLVPAVAFAQLKSQQASPSYSLFNPAFNNGIKAIGVGNLTPNAMNCDQNPTAPWCQDLYKAVCALKKSESKLKELNGQIEAQTYMSLPPNASQKAKNDAAAKAIQMADTMAYKEGVTLLRDEVRKLMDPAKWNVINLFNGNNYPSPEKQKQMAQIVLSVKLKTGGEYVAGLMEYGRKQAPNMPVEVLREQALTMYTSTCGKNGLEVNAFYENGDLVLCPGLVYSLADYKANAEEIKAAIIFTMSHEITHSIDYVEMPDVYDKMKSCYEKTTKNPNIFQEDMAAEITADYYGAYSLAKYLNDRNISGTQAVRIIALATDGFCSAITSSDDHHPSGEFRVNQSIAKTPLMRKVLGCSDPSKNDPSCALKGEITQ